MSPASMENESCATIAEFEKLCANVATIQEELLTSILCDNAGCNYLRKYGSPRDTAAFKSQVPIISYDDVAGEIEKIANGDGGAVLCHYQVTRLFLSSGTSSGKHKAIPGTAKNETARSEAENVSFAYRKRCFPNVGTGRVLAFIFSIGQVPTKSGIPLGAVSTFRMYSEKFIAEIAGRLTTPYEMLVAAGSNWREMTYCHLLCALLQRDEVEEIDAVFAYTICGAVRVLQSDWQEICDDIRTGRLSSSKVTNSKLREAFASSFCSSRVGNLELADHVFQICSTGSWSGILSLLFPQAKLLSTVLTGTMAPLVPMLKHYTGEKITIAGRNYVSSEGLLGINTNPAALPEKIVYTILPHTLYYEFLPLGRPLHEVVSAHEVVLGKQYELVITNFAGLYRFRNGDVVTVTSKIHATPQLAFSHRKDAVLSVHTEMVDEKELQNTVMKVAKEAGIRVTNFTCRADPSTFPAHYVIFWELESSEAKIEVLAKCCSDLDRSLNQGYIGQRLDGALGPLEVIVVEGGTFEKLMEEAIQSGASPGQYKISRCITSPRMLEVLHSRRLASYQSEEMQTRTRVFKPVF